MGDNIESDDVEKRGNDNGSNNNSSNYNEISLPNLNVIAHHVNEISLAGSNRFRTKFTGILLRSH